MRFSLVLSLAALLAASRPAASQVAVTPVRDLAFGTVIVGVPTSIEPNHPVRSGEFRVTGPPSTKVQLRLTLPNRLDGPAGATMPISFANNDALTVSIAPNSIPVTFNPQATRNVQLTGGAILVFLGGTVSPAGNQRQGGYAGTVTLTVNIQ